MKMMEDKGRDLKEKDNVKENEQSEGLLSYHKFDFMFCAYIAFVIAIGFLIYPQIKVLMASEFFKYIPEQNSTMYLLRILSNMFLLPIANLALITVFYFEVRRLKGKSKTK
ncbi:hypothetical protein PRVXH_002137 [Proteinivorax hydrogeniformans]|uniref:Uncharacterized protein n=1 Tax=Proteinivorax hydrogeniformans TaxID=1826727 RepID=A0AAU8HRW9_9FIRM